MEGLLAHVRRDLGLAPDAAFTCISPKPGERCGPSLRAPATLNARLCGGSRTERLPAAGQSRCTTARPVSWACIRRVAFPPSSTSSCPEMLPRCRKSLCHIHRVHCRTSLSVSVSEGRTFPHQAPRLWLRRLLLMPPPPAVSAALREACAFLSGQLYWGADSGCMGAVLVCRLSPCKPVCTCRHTAPAAPVDHPRGLQHGAQAESTTGHALIFLPHGCHADRCARRQLEPRSTALMLCAATSTLTALHACAQSLLSASDGLWTTNAYSPTL